MADRLSPIRPLSRAPDAPLSRFVLTAQRSRIYFDGLSPVYFIVADKWLYRSEHGLWPKDGLCVD
jgi:hypothetical protein